MKLQHYSFVLFLGLIAACSDSAETESQSSEVPVNHDSITSQEPELAPANSAENLYCFTGSIDDQHQIFLEFQRSEYAKGIYLKGSYHYLSNEISFELSGDETDGHVVLLRKKAGDIAETFEFDLTDDKVLKGTWQKGDAASKPLQLTRVNQSNENSSSFLYNTQYLIDGGIETRALLNYETIEHLKVENNALVSDGDFNGAFCGSKIYLDDDYENDAGGHTDQVIFANLKLEAEPGENAGTSILLIECIESWENDLGDIDSDEDDVYEMNDDYTCTARVFNFEGGEVYELQELIWEGKGVAVVYYFDNRIVLQANDRKEVVYFDSKSSKFVER